MKRNESKRISKKKSIIKVVLLTLALIIFVTAGAVFGVVFAIVKSVPPIDPTKVTAYLSENSVIVSQNDEVIEKILTHEFRTVVDYDQISDYMKKAIVAVEDERFYSHHGVDPKSIARAVYINLKSMSFSQGFSTITQQLTKNRYLSSEKTVTRKIKEMYIAMQLERHLTKEQILEAYLNTISLGQGAYGIEAAAQTYFSKNAKDLTLAESAMIAGVTKSPFNYELYKVVKPENFDNTKHQVVGVESPDQISYVNILGKLYVPVYNTKAKERQTLILKKMLDLGSINKQEYDEALKQDMRLSIKPDPKRNSNVETSFFNDYIKESVINDLMQEYNINKEQATSQLLTGGLRIYSTMDLNMQNKLEDAYNNFGKILSQSSKSKSSARLVSRTLDKYGNIIDASNRIVFYKKENLLDTENNLIIEKGTFKILDSGDISITNKKINYRNADITDYYTIDSEKNLLTHSVWSLDPKSCYTSDKENKRLLINKSFLDENATFYSIADNGNLIIDSKFFYKNTTGIMQPQSAFVILDYNGHIKALVGGRNIKGSNVLNRAIIPRQPGSSLKPVSVYLPALDNGFTAASVIDDVPHYDKDGNLWPRNWYGRNSSSQRNSKGDDYKGLVTLRKSVEYSINVSTVKFLEQLGITTSMEYLAKMGIINTDDPSKDTFTTREEAIAKGSSNFDENYAALGLGGMTRGISPLRMTAAYSAIANKGKYTNPVAYTKVIDKDGNTILENKAVQSVVVSDKVAYLMTDILRTTVTNGIAKSAQISSYNSKIPVAGKTGTTQNKVDAWFVGYTPYYIAGTWIGNDNPSIKLDNGSKYATILWSNIMKDVHKGLPNKNFGPATGFIKRKIDTTSGKLANRLSYLDPRGNTVKTEIFIEGTEPKTYDDVHVEAVVDISTNKLANEYCPPELVEKRVFIQRPIPYNPKDNDGYYPVDYQYEVPKQYCDVHNKFTTPIIGPEDDLTPDDDNEEDNQEDNESKPLKDKIKDKVKDKLEDSNNSILDDLLDMITSE